MNTDEIFGALSGEVYEIQISRGDKMNALTDAMYGSLVEQLNYADSDPKSKVVLLRSSNQHFSAGNDLADFLESEFNDQSNVVKFLKALASLQKPLVCAVGGAAVGIGTTMLLHCDLVIASADSKFSVPFIKLGLTPEGGSSLLLRQRCGTAKANEWLLTGKTFLADEALSAGLVNSVEENVEATWQTAMDTAQSLARSSKEVLIETKKLLKGEQTETVIEVMQKEAKLFAERLQSDEAKTAFNAFLKR